MLIVRFYQTERGRKPVEEFLKRLRARETSIILVELNSLSTAFPVQEGFDVKHLRGKLWELRIRIPGKNIRLVYSIIARELVVLNCFTKKQRREEHEIKLAEERYKDFCQRFTK